MGEAYIDRSVDTIGVVPVVWLLDAATWREAGEMGSNREGTRGAAPALRRTRGPALIDGEAAFPLNRDRVVRMSAQLFARNGYHATGIAEICAATGLSRGTLYYYVEGKETLLYEICRTQVLRMNERARAILAESMEPDARLRALAGSLLANIAEHREEWAVFFREFGSLGPERRAVIKQARDEYEGYWLQAVLEQSGTRDARIPPGDHREGAAWHVQLHVPVVQSRRVTGDGGSRRGVHVTRARRSSPAERIHDTAERREDR
jgi:AcrR family transcriptional regulator